MTSAAAAVVAKPVVEARPPGFAKARCPKKCAQCLPVKLDFLVQSG